MSPQCATRLVTIVFLIALEILTTKSNVDAFVIKQDPKKLARVTDDIEDLVDGTGGFSDDAPSDYNKMVHVNNGGASQIVAPIETTAKTEEIKKSSPNTKRTYNRETTYDPQTTTTYKPETTKSNIFVTATTIKPQLVTISEVSYVDGHSTFYADNKSASQTTTDFLLGNTETASDVSTSITNANIKETTKKNITTSYSTKSVETDAIPRSNASSTIEIDDDDFTPSTTISTIPKSQDKETTTSSEMLTTDSKPLHWKKYITIDRKRNNIMNAEMADKEYELATAETKQRNGKKHGGGVFTSEWYLDKVKRKLSTSTETDSSTKINNIDLPNSINQNQALLEKENIKNILPPGKSPIFKLPAQETQKESTVSVSLQTLSNQKYSSLENSTSISLTDFFTTTDVSKDPTTTDNSKDLTTTDDTGNLTTTDSSKTEAKSDQILLTNDVSSMRSPRAYNETETIKAAESVRNSNEITSETMKGVLTSKRAGYLDMSSKPTSRRESATGRAMSRDAKKTTPAPEPDSTTAQKQYYMQPQGQLAEDAMKEELMKEEMMNDQMGYTQQNREQSKDKDPATEKAPTTSDEILSVKPIGVDKQKTSGLYTVSPNYKPLKKIEVQPPKPFVRDPDDNSWRNESLSSLGIVFKANNSSKPLTQVLKNKTETELNAFLEKYGKSDEPELRARLEKIAEQRKTKKKSEEKSGEFGNSDSYEVLNFFAESSPSISPIPKSPAVVSSSSTVEPENFLKSTISTKDREDPINNGFLTTTAPKKYTHVSFEASDEEQDYSSLSNIDIKKTPVKKTEAARNTVGITQTRVPPERKATLQYFPPRTTQPVKVYLNDYDYDFKRKIQALEEDKLVSPLVSTSSYTPIPSKEESRSSQQQQIVKDFRLTATDVPEQPRTNIFTTPPFEGQDGFDGASYVIKHLRDFINLAARESEEDRAAYLTEPPRVPVHEVTAHGYFKDNKVKPSDYVDYDTHFRKKVLDKFVDNFNHNSERYKLDFPVLYNTSIIHSNFADESKQASSSAFMKRLYETPRLGRGSGADADCNRAVELPPEYELHYYVPEQEEREAAHSEQLLSAVRYQLQL